MSTYLTLNLSNFIVDPTLVAQVPYGLALYYLALPLARENDQVSVAMAHPENETARTMLGDLLHADIVPVRSSAEAIRAALNRFYPKEPQPGSRILAWHSAPCCSDAVNNLSAKFGAVLNAPVTHLDATQIDLDSLLNLASEEQYALTVLDTPTTDLLKQALRQSTTPLLLVRGDHCELQRILVAIRGYASDAQAIDWMRPVWANEATISLIPLLVSSLAELTGSLSVNGTTRQHLEHCLTLADQKSGSIQLKLRQGNPADRIAAELLQEAYDLLVIAAEGYGDFVAEVILLIESYGGHAGRPIFVLKPPVSLPIEN